MCSCLVLVATVIKMKTVHTVFTPMTTQSTFNQSERLPETLHHLDEVRIKLFRANCINRWILKWHICMGVEFPWGKCSSVFSDGRSWICFCSATCKNNHILTQWADGEWISSASGQRSEHIFNFHDMNKMDFGVRPLWGSNSPQPPSNVQQAEGSQVSRRGNQPEPNWCQRLLSLHPPPSNSPPNQ